MTKNVPLMQADKRGAKEDVRLIERAGQPGEKEREGAAQRGQ